MRKLKAQQITEFMLAAPLLVIFFIILTEFAFAFNANLVLNNAVSSSSAAILSEIKAGTEKTDYENTVKNYVKYDLEKNNLPNLNTLNTRLITVGEYPAVVSTYTYKPGFNYAFLPALRTINMTSTSVFPFKMPKIEDYNYGILTEELDMLMPQNNSSENIEEVI